MARDREVGFHGDPPGAVERHPERPGEWSRGNPGGPQHRARADLLAAEPHRVRGDARDGRAGAYLDADALERGLGTAAQRLRKGRKHARAALEENDARPGGIDHAEVARYGLA